METEIIKCSSINHKENNAISFCGQCRIYMCIKCEKYHSEMFSNHNKLNLEKDKYFSEIFTGFCKEKNHVNELRYFCKTHNKLCCAECITKIKAKNNGQHTDCDLCIIEDIENDKKNKLKQNIKCLEDLSKDLEQKIKEFKIISESIEKNKEELKKIIQNTFTKLRNALNNREDELLLEVDQKYNELYLIDNIKESENLPNKIKLSLERGKDIENNWNNNKLNSLINDCLNIENNISKIKILNEKLIKPQHSNIGMTFFPYEEGLNNFINSIKNFGLIKKIGNFDSNIIFEEKLVKSWLNNKSFNPELLYRKTRDGSTPDDFHKRCDNKGITITFIETTKGYKFGGYTELQWDKSEKTKKDKSTFIFSFNNKQKYTARNNNSSIGCFINEGPRFGCGFPEIYLKNTLNKGESFDNFYCTFSQGRVLTNGESSWDVKELEVHRIYYI